MIAGNSTWPGHGRVGVATTRRPDGRRRRRRRAARCPSRRSRSARTNWFLTWNIFDNSPLQGPLAEAHLKRTMARSGPSVLQRVSFLFVHVFNLRYFFFVIFWLCFFLNMGTAPYQNFKILNSSFCKTCIDQLYEILDKTFLNLGQHLKFMIFNSFRNL